MRPHCPPSSHRPPPHHQAWGLGHPPPLWGWQPVPSGSSQLQPLREPRCDLLTVGKRGPVVEGRHFGLVCVPRNVVPVGGHELQRKDGVSAPGGQGLGQGLADPEPWWPPAPPVPGEAVHNSHRDSTSSSTAGGRGPGEGGRDPGPSSCPPGLQSCPSARGAPSSSQVRPALHSSGPGPAGSP